MGYGIPLVRSAPMMPDAFRRALESKTPTPIAAFVRKTKGL
jgi:hypothetical protein